MTGLVLPVTTKIFRHILSFRSNVEQLAMILSGNVVARAATFVTSIIVARNAGAQTFGEFAFFTTIFVLVSEGANALDICYLRSAARRGDLSKDHLDRTIHIASKLGYCLIVASGAWICARYIAEYVFHKPEIEQLIRVAALSGGLVTVFTAIAAWFQARRRFFVLSVLLPIFNVLMLIAVSTGVMANTTLTQEWLSQAYLALSTGLASLAVAIWVKSTPRLDPERRHVWEFLWAGITLLGANALALIAARVDLLVLARYADFEEVGRYGVALRIALVLSLVQASVTTMVLPAAASAHGDPGRLKRYLAASGLFGLTQTAGAAFLIVFSSPIITILFGAEYAGVQPIAIVLIIVALVSSITIPLQGLIQCGDRPQQMIYLSMFRLICAVGLLLLLVPHLGGLGAAYAMVCASSASWVLMLLVVHRMPAVRSAVGQLIRNASKGQVWP